MKAEELERLYAQFYEGNTTEQEEELLVEAFRSGQMPDNLQSEKALFLALCAKKGDDENLVPDGLEARLSNLIDAKAKEERSFSRHRNRIGRNWRWIGGVAATILLLIGVGYGIADMHRYATPQDTFTNPEDAYEALQATLIEVSVNLNQGFEQWNSTRGDVEKINQEVKNVIKQ